MMTDQINISFHTVHNNLMPVAYFALALTTGVKKNVMGRGDDCMIRAIGNIFKQLHLSGSLYDPQSPQPIVAWFQCYIA